MCRIKIIESGCPPHVILVLFRVLSFGLVMGEVIFYEGSGSESPWPASMKGLQEKISKNDTGVEVNGIPVYKVQGVAVILLM